MTLPGSAGERALQERVGTARLARGFYENQMLDRLTPAPSLTDRVLEALAARTAR